MKFTHQLLAATATLALCPALPVHAQTAEQQEAVEEQQEEAQEEAEEIVVTGTFLDQGSKSATKMDVAVLDTPFSVTSYSEDFVESLETTTIADLYNYMTGVKKAGNTAYDITMRGFKSGGDDRNAIMVDGLPGLTGRYGSPPTVGVERIELVKGPMSVLYGPIQPGGFVNLVTKKPEAQTKISFDARVLSYAGAGIGLFDRNSYNFSGDVTGGTADDTLMFRLVGEYTDRTLFRDFSGDTGTYIAPSVTWNIGVDTTLTVQAEYRETTQRFDTGLVAPNSDTSLIAPITTRYQEPENYRDESGLAVTAFFNHSFGDWKWNTSFRNVDYASSQKEYSPVTVVQKTAGFVATRRARHLETERQYRYVDTNLTGKFEVFGMEHKLLVGVNLGSDTTDEDRVKFFNSSNSNAAGVCPNAYCFDISVYNPVYGRAPNIDSLPATNPTLANQAGLLTHRAFYTDSYGLYISDLISLTDWLKVSVSARAFKEKQRIVEMRVAGIPEQNKTASRTFLPSAGILIQPTETLTIYGNYAQSYVPGDPGAQDIRGLNPFAPVESEQFEIGFKTDRMIRGLTTTVALYEIKQDGILNSFNCPTGTTIDGVLVTASGNCFTPIGKTRSRGIEIEGSYSPLPGWQILAGYAYTDARITATNVAAQLGQRLQNVAEHAANLWTRYDFENGLGVGFGVTYTGQREGALGAVLLDLPAYTVVDAGLYYTHDRFSLSLKAGNVFDELYIESAGQGANGRNQIAPGAPRNITLSARVNF